MEEEGQGWRAAWVLPLCWVQCSGASASRSSGSKAGAAMPSPVVQQHPLQQGKPSTQASQRLTRTALHRLTCVSKGARQRQAG